MREKGNEREGEYDKQTNKQTNKQAEVKTPLLLVVLFCGFSPSHRKFLTNQNLYTIL